MKKLTYVFLLLIFAFNISIAQNKNIDSLFALIKTDKEDTNKVIHFYNLIREYRLIGEYEKAIPYYKQAITLAVFIADNAQKSNNKTLYIGAQKAKANTCINGGILYYNLGNYPEALKNYFEALKICEELKDKEGIAKVYNNIGNTYYKEANYTEALKMQMASLKIKKELGDKASIANSYNNIGNIYNIQHSNTEALKNYFLALSLMDEVTDKKANVYNNIAVVYVAQGNFTEAKKMEDSSLKIRVEMGDKGGIATSFINMGLLYNKQHKAKEAKPYLQKGIVLSTEVGSKDDIKEAYEGLAIVDSTLGDYKAAYEHHKLFVFYRDSLNNEETKKKTLESSMQYEFDKKEIAAKAEQDKLNAISAEEKQKQKFIIYAVASVLLIVFIFSIFLFRRFKITQKQKHIIGLQKDEVLRQKHIVEEHQKEIIDSITYAKRLQQAILPSDIEIKKYLPNNFIYYKPKDIVAGDFYWMEHLDNITFIAAADSTGHGVPGAMVSVVCSNALNRAVKEFGLRNTGKILDKTRELVLETFEKSGEEIKDGMDISLLSIDKAKQQVYWSGANNQLWYMENNELKEIKADKQPIGQTDNPKPFTMHTIELKENATFYLMTDGYPDQFGGNKGKKYKYKQLEELLIANSSKSLQDQKDILSKSFNDWKGNLEQVDDVTIIGIRI